MNTGSCSLRKEMLTFEPLRMVNVKHQYFHEQQQLMAGLHSLQLSNMDLLCNYYNSIALFYDAMSRTAAGECGASALTSNKNDLDGSTDDPASILHSALEELLIHYPAAAGRMHVNKITGRYEVQYKLESSSSPSSLMQENDDSSLYGLPFLVARADTTLSALGDVSAPHPALDILYPSAPERNHNNNPPPPVVLIQVTTFTCGSFTLALMVHHMLTDGYTTALFLKNLCSIAKGAGLHTPMDLTNRREIIKPRVPPSPQIKAWHLSYFSTRSQGETHANTELPYGCATRFAFSAASLESLRSRASNAQQSRCSRFKALAALLWKIRAKCCANSGSPPSRELPLRFPINLRGRPELPALTQSYMGVAGVQCVVRGTVHELCDSSLAYVVEKITSSIVGNMQERMQSEIDYIELQLQNGRLPHFDHGFLGIPSLVNLPFYDTDCGWGRPIYCGRPSRQLGQRMIVLDDPRSKGWNVLVVLNSPEEFEIFQGEITKCTS